MAYKPMTPFATALILMKPDGSSSAYGVAKHSYSVRNQETIYGTVRTFGGSESTENGVYSIVDTAMIDTWYRPDITPGCRIAIADAPHQVYEVIGSPEDIEMRNQYMRLRVQRVKGGA
jgi:head-tail adaptor